MSSSGAILPLPITALEYVDISIRQGVEATVPPMPLLQPVQLAPSCIAEVPFSKEEFTQRLQQEQSEASAQTEHRLRQAYDVELDKLRGGISKAIAAFESQRSDYFARVEVEVVQLSLSIAAKILHREAQVDPMLVAALARLTIEKMCEGSRITVRVGGRQAAAWQQHFANHATLASVRIVEDPELDEGDCVLDTEFGTTHLGLERQLKEIEQGFFDLLALRPDHQ